MMEFEVKAVEAKLGKLKGQTVYMAVPKTASRATSRQLEDYIINATSLARGDVRNALTSLAEFVNNQLAMGTAIELGDLGMIKPVVNSRQMTDPKEVSAATLKKPLIRFYPKQEMQQAVNRVRVKVDNQYTKEVTESTPEEP